ncbi:hypothetical protein QEN19_001649 [Hanseniaspora menglaensis]
MDTNTKSEFTIKEKNIIFFSDNLFKINNEKAIKKQLDTAIERDVAQVFFNILQEKNTADFLTVHIPLLFESLGIPESITNLTMLKHYKNLVIDSDDPNTKIVDFDKMLHNIHKLLIFMENESIIMEYWKLILFNVPFKKNAIEKKNDLSKINWFMEIINVKDLKNIEEMSKIQTLLDKQNKSKAAKDYSVDSQTFLLALKMIKVASATETLYITYLDFAHLLGKLGLLNF